MKAVAIRIVRLGTPRGKREGLRLGTVRRPPRGVLKELYARLDFFDLWLPDLAPSAPLMSWAHDEPFTPQRWVAFARAYKREMQQPATERLIALLAALSKAANFSVGCYCEDETRCHRSLLAELLADAGAEVTR